MIIAAETYHNLFIFCYKISVLLINKLILVNLVLNILCHVSLTFFIYNYGYWKYLRQGRINKYLIIANYMFL